MGTTILGLDPGVARVGFGIIKRDSMTSQYVRAGCLTTPQTMPIEDRLLMIGQDLETLIEATKPDCAVVEKVFFGINSKTAIAVSQARGVLMYILRKHNIPIEGLTPLQIKSRLTGYGVADKHQVQTLVMKLLNLNAAPQPDDAADALAAALSISPSFIPNPKKL